MPEQPGSLATDAHPRPDKARMSNAERAAAGLMTRGQAAEHERLAAPLPVRPEARSRVKGPQPDDPWADTPEDKPGTVSPDQLRTIGVKFRALGLTEQAARHAYVGDLFGTEDDISAKELSFTDAKRLIRELDSDLAKVAPSD